MACGALALAFSACDDGRTGDPDGGPIVLRDTGVDPDTGVVVMTDAGTDSGEPPDTCPAATQPAPTAAACAAETKSCIDACIAAGGTPSAVNACAQGCIDDDPSSDPAPNECLLCVSQAQISCATMNGCDEQWGEVVCCAQANCPDGSCLNTPTGPCAADVQTFAGCAQTGTAASACQTSINVCFPPPA
jgi:hypothetical protein